MTQGQKRKSAEEILGIRPARKSAEEILGVRPAPQPEQSFWENVKIGAAQGLNDYILSPALSLAEGVGSAATGDFRPLGEMAELAGRGLLKTVSAFDPMGNAYEPVAKEHDPAITSIQAERAKRQRYAPGFEDLRIVREQLEREAAANPSFSNKAARFIGSGAVAAAPAIATGVLSGGSVPAVAATTAMQSASRPENLALNVGASVVPVPVGRAMAPLLRKLRSGRSSPTQPSALTTAEAAGAKPILSEIKAADDLLPPVLEPVKDLPTFSTSLST